MDGELASRLRDAGLTEEQTRIALGVFEELVRERAAARRSASGPSDQEDFRGLFAGSESFYEHRGD